MYTLPNAMTCPSTLYPMSVATCVRFQENPEKAPVVLWLQGGPGGSSLFGLFVEHGPYLVAKGGVPELRETTWAQRYSMIYIDNPVGAGFSFTEHDDGYARNQEDVGRELHEALQQFFTLFDEYAANDFYATGESYAGEVTLQCLATLTHLKEGAETILINERSTWHVLLWERPPAVAYKV
ncbi:hypothetical protein HPB50_029171 [Hyalomma asiaticum]|nr:hypothetical protein HPB50_029171 [Hyalomma asiaticum]